MTIEGLIWCAYLATGVVAGLLGGLLGLGGGIVVVPALLFLFTAQNLPADILMHLAVATSLSTIIFTAVSASFAHHRRRAVLWSAVAALAPGIVVGAGVGAMLADHLSSEVLRRVFGIFQIGVAIQIGLAMQPPPHRVLPGNGVMLATGGGIGVLSTILGIGGGTLTVPFLVWCRVNLRHAVATSTACGFPIALVGTLTMVATGLTRGDLPPYSIGYVHWPATLAILVTSILCAPVGARLAHHLPLVVLRRVFALVLFSIGLRMVL